MKLGRIWRHGPDGAVARMVAVHPDEGRVVDLATAEGARLQRRGDADGGPSARAQPCSRPACPRHRARGRSSSTLPQAADDSADAGDASLVDR